MDLPVSRAPAPVVQLSESNLLRALHADDFALIRQLLEPQELKAGTVLYEPGDHVRFVYFPCGPSLASFMILLEDGRLVETGLIGREGAVGGIISQGHVPAYARAMVQIGGPFLRMETSALERAKMQSLTLRHLFARYADSLLAQIFQSVACNAAHSIEQRAAKWLLAALDRTGDNDVRVTQEQLAGMLGVGRSYMSRVIQPLKLSGALETRRGRLCVKDADRLKSLSCDCNNAVRRHFDTVLKGVYPSEDDDPPATGMAERRSS